MAPLPIRVYSLQSFVDLMKSLVDDGETQDFIRLVLAGQHDGKQVVVDALRNRIYNAPVDGSDDDDDNVPPDYAYTKSRDYDSFLGISPDICVEDRSIIFNIIPKFEDTLSKDLGITYEIERNEVRHSLFRSRSSD